MNVQAIYHRPESNYCFATNSKTVTLRLRFSKEEKLDGVYVLYNTKYDIAKSRFKQKMRHICDDALFSYYGATLRLNDPRLAYVFEIFYEGKVGYFCEDGLLDSYDFNFAYFNNFQVAYVNPNDLITPVEWLKNAVFYQVFVERFDKASQKDETYVTSKWNDLPTPKSFFGGDLDGICKHLPYIKSLGANALYLTPVFCSVSNHKYDIYDYYNVDPMFGGNAALQRLVNKCHEMGMKVVLDAVFNHASEKLPQFQDVLQKGKNSPYFNWFVIRGNKINKSKSNYDCFAACNYMPKLNTAEVAVQRYFADVATFWIREYGIDGWRLDVSDEVSHGFWKELRKAVKGQNPQAALIGENWHNSESYLAGDQFDTIMNYAFTKQMMDYWVSDAIDEKQLAQNLNGQLMRYTDVTNSMMFNLLDCHDTHRFYTLLGCNKHKFLCALATTVFMTGSCNVYYGDEILTEGGYDPDNRRTFDWTKLNDAETLLFKDKFVEILALKQQPALKDGSISVREKDGLLVIKRACKQQTLTLFVNKNKRGVKKFGTMCYNVTDEMQENSFVIQGRLV
ncbi:MAG: glycoside hydrolase family 13 protein [Candidatus Fimimonas sp.]